jgi:hypothetical protein
MKPTAKLRSSRHSAPGVSNVGAFLFFGCAVVFTIGLLVVASRFTPAALQLAGAPEAAGLHRTAMIQLPPGRTGLCRTFVFNNDEGSFEEGDTGECHGLIPDSMLVWTSASRTQAVARAFSFRQ